MKRALSSRAKTKTRGTEAVDAYLSSLPAAVRAGLQKVRKAIRTAASGAEEDLSYGIPAFKLDGRAFVWYAAWKGHSSLYPVPTVMRAPATDLEDYEIAKGTIRFPHDEPPPAALVKKLVKGLLAR